MKERQTAISDHEVMSYISLDDIREPKRAMRKKLDYNKVQSLAQSIKEIGLINPIVVKKDGDNYEIIAGERRYLAVKILGREKIKAIIAEGEAETHSAIMISENIHREDVPVTEESEALWEMKKMHGLTQAQLAQLIGKTESYVSERLAIANYPPGLYDALADGHITFSVARELARIEDPDVLKVYAETAIKAGVNPRLARQWVRDWKQTSKGEAGHDITHGGEIQPPNLTETEMTTGCHICNEIVPLTKIRRLNVCPDCWDSVFKSLMGQ